MKHITTLFFISVMAMNSQAQNVGIGTTTPHNSAALEINSTSKGLLLPRMTGVQRAAIVSPAKGLMVFDTDTNTYWIYNGSGWVNMAQVANGFSLPFDGSINIPGNAFRVANNGTAITGESTGGTGINASSVTGTAVNAFSSSGFGIVTTSAASTALYAFSNNEYPTINASNSNALGVAVKGSSAWNHGLLGTSAGTSKAAVRGEATGNGGYGVFGTTTSSVGYGVYGNTTSATAVFGSSQTGTGVKALSSSGLALEVVGNLKISGGSTAPVDGAVLTSDANGNASWQKTKVAFRVKGVNSNYNNIASNSPGRVHWANEEYDYDNNYFLHVGSNPGSTASSFTVPVAGLYHFDVSVGVGSADVSDMTWGYATLKLYRNGIITTIATNDGVIDVEFPNGMSFTLSTDAKLMIGDRIYVEVLQYNSGNSGGNIGLGEGPNYFNGHLVFAD